MIMDDKLKILLCEDDENLGMLLREYLAAKGYQAELCPDGEVQMVVIVPCADEDIDRLFGFAVFHGIIHQVGNGILEMQFIHIDG